MKISVLARITLPLGCVNALTQSARTVMSTIGPVLAIQYSLSAGELGLFSATMFASYCIAQLPAGLALDRWGPRRVQAVLCVVASAGFAIFAISTTTFGFVLGRLLTGIGVSTGLIGMLKGNSAWFAPQDVARATGLGMVIGTLGSFMTTLPAQSVLPLIGWRGVVWCCAGVSLCVALWNYLSVRDPGAPAKPRSAMSDLRELRHIVRAPAFRWFAPVAALLTVLNFTYLGLWAGPWLRDVAHLGADDRGRMLLVYTIGLLFGAPLTGTAISAAQHRGCHPILVPAICTVGLIAVQMVLATGPQGHTAIGLLWLAFAVLSSCGPSAYAAVASQFPPAQAGRVSTAINTMTLLLVVLLQIGIGRLVGAWPETADGGWSPQGYAIGLLITIAGQALALLWAFVGWRRAGLGQPGR